MDTIEPPLFVRRLRKSWQQHSLDIFVGTVPLLSSRPLSAVFARMEALVAAAAVVEISIDDDAEEDSALEMADGLVATHLARGP